MSRTNEKTLQTTRRSLSHEVSVRQGSSESIDPLTDPLTAPSIASSANRSASVVRAGNRVSQVHTRPLIDLASDDLARDNQARDNRSSSSNLPGNNASRTPAAVKFGERRSNYDVPDYDLYEIDLDSIDLAEAPDFHGWQMNDDHSSPVKKARPGQTPEITARMTARMTAKKAATFSQPVTDIQHYSKKHNTLKSHTMKNGLRAETVTGALTPDKTPSAAPAKFASKSISEVASTPPVEHNPLSDTLSISRPPVASTLPEQLAACRSLAKLGLARVKLDKIQQYSDATIRWVHSLEKFLGSEDTRLIFCNGVPNLNQIHKLAIFHNKPIRPPKRFICSGRGKHVRRRVPMIYRDALSEYRAIADTLSEFHAWVDVEALPITNETLDSLDSILDSSSLNRLSPKRRKAIQWYERIMQPTSSLSIHLANGNLEKLRSAVDNALRFANHVHFRRTLGHDFAGIDTPWQSLHATIEFSQSIHDVVGDSNLAAQIVDQWSTQGTHFYTLARRASSVSRRLNKLDKLTRRHEKLIHPNASDDRLISTRPENYLVQAQKAVVRLKLWTEVAVAGRSNGHLTPADVLHSLKP